MSDYFLCSSRLGFRHWAEADLPLAIGLWGDPAVTRYIAARGYTLREVQIRLELEIEAEKTHGIQYWPFFLLATGEHIGCCGLRMRASDPDVPELGVHVASRHWRQGYALEAASCVIEHAFTVRKFRAIFAGHNPGERRVSSAPRTVGLCLYSRGVLRSHGPRASVLSVRPPGE